MKTKTRPRRFLKKLFAFSLLISSFSLILYLLSLSFLNPDFFLHDLKSKKGRVLGTTRIAVEIVAAPNEPIVSISSACQEDSPVINMSWPEDPGAITFEILRNGSTLISGLTANQYQDDSVEASTTYTYQVIAHGQTQDAYSEEYTVTTSDCQNVPSATCQIITLNDIDLSTHSDQIRIRDRNPDFSGTSSIPNALMTFIISGTSNIIVTGSANFNGYWYFEVPENLDYGWNTLTAIATDRNDPSRTASDSVSFEIERSETAGKKTTSRGTESSGTQPPGKGIGPSEIAGMIPFELQVYSLNLSDTVYAGNPVEFRTKLIPRRASSGNVLIRYSIIDPNENEITAESEIISWDGKELDWTRKLKLPRLIDPGRYKLLVSAQKDGFTIASNFYFFAKEAPLIQIGRTTITLSFLFDLLSWLIIFFLIIIPILFLLSIFEYWLSRKAFRKVDEYIIDKLGYFSKKKGGA